MTEKEQIEKGLLLPLMEEFYTLQGEGYHSGKAAYFVRIGGCDVGCHWCDVKESWDASMHPATSTDEIVKNVLKYSDTVVITGGEPLQWNMDYLTKQLHKNKCKIHVETSGAFPISGTWDWICLSPKKNKLPMPDIYKKANELKVIIRTKQDFIFAEKQANLVSKDCILYMQPEWSVRDKIVPLITDYLMKNPKWKVSIQMHKYLNIP